MTTWPVRGLEEAPTLWLDNQSVGLLEDIWFAYSASLGTYSLREKKTRAALKAITVTEINTIQAMRVDISSCVMF